MVSCNSNCGGCIEPRWLAYVSGLTYFKVNSHAHALYLKKCLSVCSVTVLRVGILRQHSADVCHTTLARWLWKVFSPGRISRKEIPSWFIIMYRLTFIFITISHLRRRGRKRGSRYRGGKKSRDHNNTT